MVDRDGLGLGLGVGVGIGRGVGLGVGVGVGLGVGVASFTATGTGVGEGVALGVGDGVGDGEGDTRTTRLTGVISWDVDVKGITVSASEVGGAVTATAEHTRHNTKNIRIDRELKRTDVGLRRPGTEGSG